MEDITADLRQLEKKPKPHHSRWAPPALSPNRAGFSPESNPSRTPTAAPGSCLLPPHQVPEKCPLLPKDNRLGQGDLCVPLSGNTPCTTVPTMNSMALCTRPARTCWKRPLSASDTLLLEAPQPGPTAAASGSWPGPEHRHSVPAPALVVATCSPRGDPSSGLHPAV